MEGLICMTLVLAAGNILCALAILQELRAAHQAPQTPQTPPVQDQAEGPRTLRLDEGFENLMAYQVRLGRGRVTGGEAE